MQIPGPHGKLFVVLRAIQFVVAIPIIAAVVNSNGHPGWWTELKTLTAAVCVIAVLTLIATLLLAFLHIKDRLLPRNRWQAVSVDVVMALLWVAAIAQFFRDKGLDQDKKTAHDLDPSDFEGLPEASWYAGSAMSIIELLLFIISSGLVFKYAGRQ